jgi:hypothetical protein
MIVVPLVTRSRSLLARLEQSLRRAPLNESGACSFEVVRTVDEAVGLNTNMMVDFIIMDASVFQSRATRFARLVESVDRCAPIPSVIAGPSVALTAHEWFRLGRSGVREVVLDTDSALDVARRLRMASGLSEAILLIDSLPDWIDDHWKELFVRALPHAHRGSASEPPMSTAVLADLWMRGASARQLAWRVSRDFGFPPGWLVRWLIAVRAFGLSHTRGGWNSVVVELGFRRRSNLRSFIVRLAGCELEELSLDLMLRLFVRRVAGS